MNKTKRIITIIVLLVLVTVIILGLLWFLSRRTAKKNDMPPMSFRKFLGLDTVVHSPADGWGGEYGSDFIDDSNGSDGSVTNPDGPDIEDGPGTKSSEFTNSSTSPDGVGGGDTSGGSTPGSNNDNVNGNGGTNNGESNPWWNNNGNNSGSNNNGQPNDNGTITVPGGTERVCSEADVNITFTAEELARLEELQNRFYKVAQTLHNDAEVAAQIANYDTFKLRQKHIDEMSAYCENAAQKGFNDPMYKRKVPTPFWYVPEETTYNEVYQLFLGSNSQEVERIQNQLRALPDTEANASARASLIAQLEDVTGKFSSSNVPLGYIGIGFPGMVGGEIDRVYRDIPNQGPKNGWRSIEQVLRLNLW